MRPFIKHIGLMALLVIPVFSFAQSDGSLNGRTFQGNVVTNIQLNQANREYDKMTESPMQPNPKKLSYKEKDVQLALPKLDSKIRILKLAKDTLDKFYGNYVKAGFGNYVTPYLEGYFASKRSTQYMYGAQLKHLSSKNGPVRFARNSDTYLRAFGSYFMKNTTVSGNMSYQHLGYHYYGYNTEIPLDRDSIRQRYGIFSAELGLDDYNRKSPFHYNFKGGYYLMTDRYGVKESELAAGIQTSYLVKEFKTVVVDGEISGSTRTDSSGNVLHRSFVMIRPAFVYNKDKIYVRAGLNFAYTNDTIEGSDGLRMYPSLSGQYTLIEKKLYVFGGIDGQMEKNLLRKFVMENPYLGGNIPLLHTNKKIELFAGGKGNLGQKFSYQAKVSYASYKNLYFFNNSALDSAKFTVLYDTAITNVTSLQGEFSYEWSGRLRLGATGQLNHYNVSTLDAAWHRPGFIGTFYAHYNLHKKIYINADIFYISGITGKNLITDKEVDLPSITDVNLKAEYRVSDTFSGFLEFNNILSNKYQRYLYYQVRGLNVMAGITYSF